MGFPPPLSQYGALIHRVRTHSLLRVEDSNALGISEEEDHLLRPWSMHSGFNTAWLPHSRPTAWTAASSQGCGRIWWTCPWWHCRSGLPRTAAEEAQGSPCCAGLDPPLCLALDSCLVPSVQPFYKAKINSESKLHCGKSQIQHGGKLSGCQEPVLLDSSNNIGRLFFFWH